MAAFKNQSQKSYRSFLMLGAFIVEIFMAPAIIQVAATLFGSYNTIQFTGAYACFLLYALIWFMSSFLFDVMPRGTCI